MTAIETWSGHAVHFVLGMLVSLVMSAVAVPLLLGGVVVAHFGGAGFLAVASIIFVPIAIAVTYWLVRNNSARILGALVFYPVAALTAYVAYDQSIARPLAEKIAADSKAMELDYSSRTIAQPLGTIDVLGLPRFAWPCHDTCARILLNGIANEVVAVSFDATIDMKDAAPSGREGPPWVFRRYRLGRGKECLAPEGPMSETGAQVQWIQSNGIFDVCIVISAGDSKLENMILIDHGPHAKRPHGPSAGPVEGTAVAYQVTDGRLSEIVRWEWGVYEYAGKWAPGKSFTILDFAKALSGRGETDRLAEQNSLTFREAVERVHSHLHVMPNMDGWAPFEFVRKVHEAEVGRGNRRASIDADLAVKLKQLPDAICRGPSRRVTPKQCFDRYNEVIAVIFTPEVAAELRWAS
jgi:hypothetical protein